MNDGHLLRGAKQIAAYVLGDEAQHKAIYGLAGELGLFTFGGLLCGFTGRIDKIIATKADAPVAERLSMRRGTPPTQRDLRDRRRGKARAKA